MIGTVRVSRSHRVGKFPAPVRSGLGSVFLKNLSSPLMKTLIIAANVEIMRAFRHNENTDSPDLGLPPAEIVLPSDAAAKRRWQGVNRRMEEISENVDWLVADEQADRWMFAAPLGVVASVRRWLNHGTIERLCGTRIADLTALTGYEVGRVFELPLQRSNRVYLPVNHLVWPVPQEQPIRFSPIHTATSEPKPSETRHQGADWRN